MKNKHLLCAIFFIVAFITSCNHNGPSKPKRTVITGHIKNLQVYPGENKMVLEVVDFGGGLTKHTGIIDNNGSFKIYFDQYITEDVKLTQDFRPSPIVEAIIAHPGDSIHVELDYAAIGDVKFSGDAAKTNTDLFLYNTGYYTMVSTPAVRLPLPYPEIFKGYAETMKQQLIKNKNEFIDKEQPNDEVKAWTKNYINLRYYIAMGTFFSAYRMVVKQPVAPALVNEHINLEKRQTPELKDYINFGDDLNDIYTTKMLNANSYNLLNFLMPPPAKDENGIAVSNQQIKDKVAQINKGNNSPLIKQLLTAGALRSTLMKHDPDAFDKNRGLLDSNIQAPFIKQPLLNLYADVKKELANPQADANATMHNSVYNQKKTIIDTLMAKNKGRVIYVDFWASWCRPCIAAMPYSKQLEEHYKGKNITFAFVCLDSSKDDWNLAVANLQLTGNQYYCDGVQTQSIISGLKFLSFPHYVMINKNGEVITNGNGFRPNDPLTVKTIDKLLN